MYDHQCARAGAHECVEVIINSAVDGGAGGGEVVLLLLLLVAVAQYRFLWRCRLGWCLYGGDGDVCR